MSGKIITEELVKLKIYDEIMKILEDGDSEWRQVSKIKELLASYDKVFELIREVNGNDVEMF